MYFTIAFYSDVSTLNGSVFHVTTDSDSLKYTTQINGGFGQASLVLNLTENEIVHIGGMLLGAHCRIWDAFQTVVHEGRVGSVAPDFETSTVAINSVGYYEIANELMHGGSYSTPVYAHEVFAATLALTQNLWNTSKCGILASNCNIDLANDDEDLDLTKDKMIADAIKELTRFGYRDDTYKPLNVAVWDNRVAHLTVEPSLYRDDVDWVLDIDQMVPGSVKLETNRNTVKNSVWAWWDTSDGTGEGPSFSTVAAEDSLSISRYGTRSAIIDVGKANVGNAQFFADVVLAQKKEPVPTISFSVQSEIYQRFGRRHPVTNIRAGDVISMRNPSVLFGITGGGQTDLYADALGYVVKTSYTASTDQLNIEIGSRTPSFEVYFNLIGMSTNGL